MAAAICKCYHCNNDFVFKFFFKIEQEAVDTVEKEFD